MGQAVTKLGNRVVDQQAVGRGPHHNQTDPAIGKLQHLQGLGVLDELLDVAHHRLFGANHMVDRKTGFVQQGIAFVEFWRAQAGDGGGHVEHIVGNLANHEVGLVGRGAGNHHVGIFGPGFAQHRGLNAVAHHATQVQSLFQKTQTGGILVDDGDVVLLRDQTFSDTFAYTASAQDDDVHGAG